MSSPLQILHYHVGEDPGLPPGRTAASLEDFPVAAVDVVAAPDAWTADGAPARTFTSNEAAAPSRVFVLVLDSHHVSATRARTVKSLARQFVENYVGPNDYAGVFSPGAVHGDEDAVGDRRTGSREAVLKTAWRAAPAPGHARA